MTIDLLIERQEEDREIIGADAEVRLMTQQNWPFENSITGVCSGSGVRLASWLVDRSNPFILRMWLR